jgi:carboxylate-amine ligase
VTDRVGAPELTKRLMERLRPHSSALGSAGEFDFLQDILDNGTGSARQALVYEANHDLHEVVREIVEASVPEAAETLGD